MEIGDKRQGGGEDAASTDTITDDAASSYTASNDTAASDPLLSRLQSHRGEAETLLDKWDDAGVDGNGGRRIFVPLICRLRR